MKTTKKALYDLYMQSPEWRSVKKAFYAKNARRCSRCKSTKRLQLHHLTYKHIFDERNHLGDLICLCSICHRNEHYNRPIVARKPSKRKSRKQKQQPRERAGVDQAAKALARWAKADAA